MEKCEVCGFEGEFVNEEYVGYDLIFCPDCYNSRTESCNHERYGYAKYFVGNGFRVQKFCSNCFSLFGCAIKHSDVDMVNVKTIEKDKYDRIMNNMKNSRKDIVKLKNCIPFGKLMNIGVNIRNILTLRTGKKRDRQY